MWTPANNRYGVAIHNFQCENIRFGLNIDVGDSVEILEECKKWYRGSCPRKSSKVGIFPKSYVHIKDITKVDPVVAECAQVLREWSEIWKRLYVERDTYKFTTLRKVMFSLLESRRELLGATLTQDQTIELQMVVISKVDWGNRKLGLDLVPRIGPLAVDSNEIGVVGLHQVHVNSAENAKASSSRGTLRKKTIKKLLTHHLYFCMRDFGHRVGDDAEVYFYLYDAYPSRMRALSERFLVKISKDGFSNYIEKLHSNCTVFTDLGAAELGENLYLVACVMRVGKIIHSESIKKNDKITTSIYRRPYGIGVLSLRDICQIDTTIETEEKEYSFGIYQCEEKDFHQLHELIIKKTNSKYSPLNVVGGGGGNSQNNYGVVVSMKLLHGGLGQARQEQPLLFQGTTITRKMGFPDVIMPGDIRNDMFITLERGEFEKGGKSTAKNIEVTITILENNGKILSDCLWGASGMDAQNNFKSMILYHQNSPCWNETLRLSVPIDKFSGAHVRFEFRHCSTREKSERRLFGFSFARLMETSGATLADGLHELYVYKCEDVNKLNSAAYLKLPSKAKDLQSQQDTHSNFNRSSKEMFIIKSLLCSTKLTQNSDLLSLLQWRAEPKKIQDSLTGLLRLKDEELIKFLQDVLDALFAMFSDEEGNSTENSGLVFHVLVSIFSLLQSNKFKHFKPVMNAYIENHFAAALVYKGLITSVEHLAVFMTKAEHPEPFQKCFGSLEYIFKLIIQSRKLFARSTGGEYEDCFRRDLYSLFSAFNSMLIVPSYDVIIPTQEALLHSTGVVLEQLKDTLPPSELGLLARNMLDAIPKDSPSKLIQAKLHAVKDLVSGELFHDDESRFVILTVACKHLQIHLMRHDELHLCADILSEILSHLYDEQKRQQKLLGEKLTNTLQNDIEYLCNTILNILMQTIKKIIQGSTTILAPLVAALLGLLQLLNEQNYKHFWDKLIIKLNSGGGGGNQQQQQQQQIDTTQLKEFLHCSLAVFKELVSQDWHVFPQDWFIMKLSANNVIRKALEEFAKPLVYKFLNEQLFDSQLWWSYFSLSVSFLTQSCLQLEQYNEIKRRKILYSHGGDMRVHMGFQILSMWSQLGEHKLHFIPSMVGPFLEVTLVPEPALRRATLTVFYDMMQCEQNERGSFRLVESELIDKLDLLISDNKGDDDYRELFNSILMNKVQTENPHWREFGITFISSVTRLLERLLDYRSVMQGDENRDKRMTCTVNLLNFYKNEINRKEMYLRYIYKLHDLHLQAENYTEAGFTLKLYADMLNWDKRTIINSPNDMHNKDPQPEYRYKEKLYNEILNYFDKGKCWEKGIPLCKELAILYETRLFDYNKLSEILIMEAKFFQNILTQLRPEPEYFRVGFYGMGFPLFVRNKQFVYRGLEYERIGTFTQRLQTEFPQAQNLTINSPPKNSILTSPEQFIQISNVKPVRAVLPSATAMVPIPEKIARFYEVNDVTRFIHDRPVYKGQIDKDNEFKSLWIERTTLDISCSLPGILRWFEVTAKNVQEITPVEFACETMENIGKELGDLIVQYRNDPKRNINPFSMRLQGIIDANVMGGISKYQEAFFSEQFLKHTEDPNQITCVQRLKFLILDQIQVIETALDLHGQLAPAGVQPLHSRLLERFSQLQQSLSELGKLKRQYSESIVNTPLPPLPIDKRAVSLGNNHQHHISNSGGFIEQDDTYTKPVEYKAPPIPSRPKSTGFISFDSADSPQQSKQSLLARGSSVNAPPLPPRGVMPEKRASNPMAFNEFLAAGGGVGNISSVDHYHQCINMSIASGGSGSKRSSHKYSVVDISFDDPECNYYDDQHLQQTAGGIMPLSDNIGFVSINDLRDSGISTDSRDHLQQLNNLNASSILIDSEYFFEKQTRNLLNGDSVMNISAQQLQNIIPEQLDRIGSVLKTEFIKDDVNEPPPPIPPKSTIPTMFNESNTGNDIMIPSSSSQYGLNNNNGGNCYSVPKSPKEKNDTNSD